MSKWVPEEKKELEKILYSLAWKWAVLAYYVGKVYQANIEVPKDVIKNLTQIKTMIDSGCYSACEIMGELRKVEAKLFLLVIEMGKDEVNKFLEMITKAISGNMKKEDIDLTVAKPILSDCRLPCVCDRELKPIT